MKRGARPQLFHSDHRQPLRQQAFAQVIPHRVDGDAFFGHENVDEIARCRDRPDAFHDLEVAAGRQSCRDDRELGSRRRIAVATRAAEDHAIGTRRHGLRYNLPVGQLLASVILTDAGESPVALCIAPRGAEDEEMAVAMKDFAPVNGSPAWVWRVGQEAMPTLRRQSRSKLDAECST